MAKQHILYIHGIAQRKDSVVNKQAASLQKGLEDRGLNVEVLPFYWGGIAPQTNHVDAVVGHHNKATKSLWKATGDTLSRPVIRGSTTAKSWLKKAEGKEDEAHAIYRAGKQKSRKLRTGAYGWKAEQFRFGRLRMTEMTMRFYGDIIAYQGETLKRKIQTDIRKFVAENFGDKAGTATQPLHIISHSLGGMIAYDLMLHQEQPWHIARWATLGSQIGMFHIMDPRQGTLPFDGEPISLPPQLHAWSNIWDVWDPLAFAASGVFKLADGTAPIDIPVMSTRMAAFGSLTLQSHLKYFKDKQTFAALAQTFR